MRFGRNVGGTSAPGAGVAPHGVVDGHRDVVGAGTRLAHALQQVEEGRRRLGRGGQLTRRWVRGDGGRDLGEGGGHAIELAPDERLDPGRGGGIGRAQPPPLERHAGEPRQRRGGQAGRQQAPPAHLMEDRPLARTAGAVAGERAEPLVKQDTAKVNCHWRCRTLLP